MIHISDWGDHETHQGPLRARPLFVPFSFYVPLDVLLPPCLLPWFVLFDTLATIENVMQSACSDGLKSHED